MFVRGFFVFVFNITKLIRLHVGLIFLGARRAIEQLIMCLNQWMSKIFCCDSFWFRLHGFIFYLKGWFEVKIE